MTASSSSYGGCSVTVPILPSEPTHLVELSAETDGLHVRVESMAGVLLVEQVSQWAQVEAWREAATALRFQHTPDEPKDQQAGESYLTWLKRTLSFARTYGAPDSEPGAWACGYCALGRHEDCIVDCGCSDPRCQPHSSGTTGAGIHDLA